MTNFFLLNWSQLEGLDFPNHQWTTNSNTLDLKKHKKKQHIFGLNGRILIDHWSINDRSMIDQWSIIDCQWSINDSHWQSMINQWLSLTINDWSMTVIDHDHWSINDRSVTNHWLNSKFQKNIFFLNFFFLNFLKLFCFDRNKEIFF